MTDEKINALINRRNKLTDRRDGLTDWKRIKRIDAQLSQVPPGQRNDVDLLIGRMCAVLPKRVVMVQHADGAQEVATEFVPYHERATVHIPDCTNCGMSGYNITPEELQDAGGVSACEHCDTLVSPEFGPQLAPSDYRIANRPDNMNWHGVIAWFDEAVKSITDATPEAIDQGRRDWNHIKGDLDI